MSAEPIVLAEGSNLNTLDIFLNVDGTPINASGVFFQLIDAAGIAVTPNIPATNPSIGQYQASGTVPTGGTLGTWRADWTIHTTAGTISFVAENFCVNAINVALGFESPSSVLGSIYEAIRVDMGDTEAAFLTDSFLRQVVIKAVRRLNNKLGLAPTMRGPIGVQGNFGGQRIKVIPITLDLDTGLLTPQGDEYEDLLILQSEYIIVTSELAVLKRMNAGAGSGPASEFIQGIQNDDVEVVNADGVKIKVGGQRIQVRATLNRLHIETIRNELDMAVKRYLARLTGNFSKCIW